MNKTFFKSILFVGLAACMLSCKDDNSPLDGGNTPQGVNVEFDYSQAKLGKSVNSSATLNGSSDVDWTIEVEEGDFFSVEPMSGKAGDFTLTVTATKANTFAEKQYSKFIFNASGRKYPITVIHLEDDIRLEVSGPADNIFTFATDGGTSTFNVTANTEWIVKTKNAEDWIHFDETNVGKIGENMEVKVSVDPNPFAKVREGKFEVRVPESTSNEYTVTQDPAPLKYTIKDKNTDLTTDGLTELGGGGDTRTITLNANADWKIEAGTASGWLTFGPSEGVASLEPVEVKVIAEPNPDMDTAEGRSGSFTVTFGDGSTVTINVQQNKGEMPADAKNLKALETTLEGENNDVLNWSSESDYTKWTGVKFEGSNLAELNLSGKGLKGYIPASISQFTSLKVLDLSDNQLTASQGLQPVKYGNVDEEAYIPAIPVEIKNLTELTTFKLKGNKIEGVFPSDLVNHSHYFEWDPMTNIYPQSGEKSDISYTYGSGAKYDTNSKADPSKWKFRLTSTGILRAIYNNMGGANWGWTYDPNANAGTKYPQPSGERPIYMDVEYKLVSTDYATHKVPGVHQVNGNKDITGKGNVVSAFGHVTKMVGEFPLEILMNNFLAQLYVFGSGSQFTKMHPLMISRLTYFKVTGVPQFTMNITDIHTNLHQSPKSIDLRNNGLTGTLNTNDLPVGCNTGGSDPKTWTDVLEGNQVTISGN